MGNASAGGLAYVTAGGAGGGAGTGFTSTSTAGTALVGTLGAGGLSVGVPAWLTTGAQSTQTQPAGNIAGVGTSVTGNLSMTMNSAGLAFNGTNLAGTGTAVTGNLAMTLNSTGLSVNAGNLAGTGTAVTGNLSMTLNTTGLSVNAGGLAGTATAVTGNASITLNSAGLSFNGSNIAGVGTTTSGNLSMTLNSAGLSLNAANLAGTGTALTGRASITLNSTGLSFNGSNLAGVGTSTASTTGGPAMAINSSGVTLSLPELTRRIWPSPTLTALSAPGNASMSIQYLPLDQQMTGSRIDALMAMSMASSAANSVAGIILSVYVGISTRNASTLSSLSSGSTQTTYTYNSNSAGNTQFINASNIYAISCPVNFNMPPGEYFVGFNIVSNSSNTNLGTTASIYGGNNIQTALNYAEITNQSASSSNLFGGMGVFTAATTGMPVSVNLNAIAQTGTSLSQANIALVFRNA